MPLSSKQRVIRDGSEVKRDEYDFNAVCAVCEQIWGSHKGILCPAPRIADSVDLFYMVARGEISADVVRFVWRGTYFVPLLDHGDLVGFV